MSEIEYKDFSNEKLSPEQLRQILKTSVVPKKHVLKDLLLLDKNANIMPASKFKRLNENMEHDGIMTQWPFVMKMPNGKYLVVSGNHRVKSGLQSGIQEEWCITCEVTLPRDEALRIQVSHNAIHGDQRNVVLLEIAGEFKNTELLRLSGADFELEKLNVEKMEFKSIDTGGLDYREVVFYFTDFEIKHMDKVLDELRKKLDFSNDPIYFIDQKKHKKFIDTVTELKREANIKSTSTVISYLIDYAEKHMPEIIKSLQPEEIKSDTINE